MRSIRIAILLTAAALLAAGCSGHVETERNARVRIPVGSRYAWTDPGPSEVPGEKSPATRQRALLRDRIHLAIDGELARKGLRLAADPAEAKFTVHYHFGVVRREEWVGETMPGPYGPMPYMYCGHRGCRGAMAWGWYGPPEMYYRQVRYRQGTLMFDLVERATGEIAFRAVGTKPIDRDDITPEGVQDAVGELLEDLEADR